MNDDLNIKLDSNKILEQYKIVVKFLGEYLGEDYEVILHDLSKLPNTIVCIANNGLSNRKVGGPITNSALKMIKKKIYSEKDYIVNYKGKSDSKIFRSATMFIKDEYGEVIGLLCINFTDERYIDLSTRLFEILHTGNWIKGDATRIFEDEDVEKNGEIEEYHGSIDELMDNIYQEAIADIRIPSEYMKQEDRIDVVRDLEKKGMFKLKGAVAYVSNNLKCSKATIYRYLNMINEK